METEVKDSLLEVLSNNEAAEEHITEIGRYANTIREQADVFNAEWSSIKDFIEAHGGGDDDLQESVEVIEEAIKATEKATDSIDADIRKIRTCFNRTQDTLGEMGIESDMIRSTGDDDDD